MERAGETHRVAGSARVGLDPRRMGRRADVYTRLRGSPRSSPAADLSHWWWCGACTARLHLVAAGWTRETPSSLRHLFPYAPKRFGHDKRLRDNAGLLRGTLAVGRGPGHLGACPRPGPDRRQNYFRRGFGRGRFGCCGQSQGRAGQPEPPLPKSLRQIIESINEPPQAALDREQRRERTAGDVVSSVVQRIPELTVAIGDNAYTGQPALRSLIAQAPASWNGSLRQSRRERADRRTPGEGARPIFAKGRRSRPGPRGGRWPSRSGRPGRPDGRVRRAPVAPAPGPR